METDTPSVGQKAWLTVPEVAQELRIPRSRCYELVQRGELPAVRIGERSIRINRAELERFYWRTGVSLTPNSPPVEDGKQGRIGPSASDGSDEDTGVFRRVSL